MRNCIKLTESVKISFKLLAYNVRGPANMLLFNDFFDYVNTHDVFVLIKSLSWLRVTVRSTVRSLRCFG